MVPMGQLSIEFVVEQVDRKVPLDFLLVGLLLLIVAVEFWVVVVEDVGLPFGGLPPWVLAGLLLLLDWNLVLPFYLVRLLLD